MCAAAADINRIDRSLGLDEVTDRVGNRPGGEADGRCQHVVTAQSQLIGARLELPGEGGAEFTMPRRFRRRFFEIRGLYELVDQLHRDLACGSPPPSVVELTLTGIQGAMQGVDHHVAGTGIEGDDVVPLARLREIGEVGDTADVENDPAGFTTSPQKKINVRGKRRPLPPHRHVTGTKIPHRRNPG